MKWSSYREREVPFLEGGVAYLDYALRGLVPQVAVAATRAGLRSSTTGKAARGGQEQALEALRAGLVRLVGWTHGEGPQHSGTDQVCLTANTTTAIAILVASVRWRAGERVLLHADEVASNRLPWEAMARERDLELVVLPSRDGRLELEDLAVACREPVAWASFAALCLDTGDSRPVGQIAEMVHGAGGRLCLDAAQAAGSTLLGEADAIAGSGRKWLCGPPEVGFLLLQSEAATDLEPLTRGGCSGSGARALEGGVAPLLPAIGLGASLQTLEAMGWPAIYARIEERARALRGAGLEAGWKLANKLPLSRQGPIVHFAIPEGAPSDLEAELEAVGVYARVAKKRGTLRAAPHAWTSDSEIESFVGAVQRICSRP